ncbi:alkaline phosphatase [Pontiellaceae bacterium B12219]|nr:alkaline phosphatase [Pontiellaceae bacterium B12219]
MNRRLFIGSVAVATSALGMSRKLPAAPKYIFLMIGDGMGEAQREIAERYIRMKYPKRDTGLVMNQLPVRGKMTTHNISGGITDSAASGTALACGQKTVDGAVCMAEDLKTPLRPVAYDAQEAGMKVGIVTSVPVDHATPACFYARVPKRGMYYEIDEQITPTGFEYFAGETLLGRKKAKGKTSPDELIQQGGYQLVQDRVGFDALKNGDSKIVVEHDLGYAIDGKQEISLADLTAKGIEVLDGKQGFFMMVEGGKIDWSGHANDLATNIHETLAFDEAVAVAKAFCDRHPDDSLLIVTADHETGGLELESAVPDMVATIDAQEFRGQKYMSEVSGWKKSGSVSAETACDRLVKSFGLSSIPAEEAAHIQVAVAETMSDEADDTRAPEIQKMYGKRNAAVMSCQHALAGQAGATWTSYKHTLVPVTTTAYGRWADRFGGDYDNADIGKRLKQLIQS